MNRKVRLLTAALLVMVLIISIPAGHAASITFPNETLHYTIAYKWGMIHKETGEATLKLRNSGSRYDISLTARTRPWADKIFKVRDTLRSSMDRAQLRPLSYSKISHEGGKYGRDDIKYTYMRGQTYGHATRTRVKKGKTTQSKIMLSASESAFDMLSIFYYLRTLDYAHLRKGDIHKTVVFSGKKKEILSIQLIGIEKVSVKNRKNIPSYHVRFRFTSENGRKSSDDMDTWISADTSRIPLRLEGNLPIGKIKCYLTN